MQTFNHKVQLYKINGWSLSHSQESWWSWGFVTPIIQATYWYFLVCASCFCTIVLYCQTCVPMFLGMCQALLAWVSIHLALIACSFYLLNNFLKKYICFIMLFIEGKENKEKLSEIHLMQLDTCHNQLGLYSIIIKEIF